MGNKTIINTIYGITLISVLLAGSFLGPIPYADADHNNDSDCKKKKKYNNVCDLERPKVKITFPEKRDRLSPGEITILGTATDEISGIKKVEVKVKSGPFQQATLTGGDNWEFTTDELDPGFYWVIVKATDFVNNKGYAFTYFFVVE